MSAYITTTFPLFLLDVSAFPLQLHDQGDLCLLCHQQSPFSQDAGVFLHFGSLPVFNLQRSLCMRTPTCAQEWLYIATCMSAYIMGPCYVVLMCGFIASLHQSLCVYNSFLSLHHLISLMFVFGINKLRLFAFIFFGWKLNAVIR